MIDLLEVGDAFTSLAGISCLIPESKVLVMSSLSFLVDLSSVPIDALVLWT